MPLGNGGKVAEPNRVRASCDAGCRPWLELRRFRGNVIDRGQAGCDAGRRLWLELKRFRGNVVHVVDDGAFSRDCVVRTG